MGYAIANRALFKQTRDREQKRDQEENDRCGNRDLGQNCLCAARAESRRICAAAEDRAASDLPGCKSTNRIRTKQETI